MGYDNDYYNVAAAPDVNKQAELRRRDRLRQAVAEFVIVAVVSTIISAGALGGAWLIIHVSNGGGL